MAAIQPREPVASVDLADPRPDGGYPPPRAAIHGGDRGSVGAIRPFGAESRSPASRAHLLLRIPISGTESRNPPSKAPGGLGECWPLRYTLLSTTPSQLPRSRFGPVRRTRSRSTSSPWRWRKRPAIDDRGGYNRLGTEGQPLHAHRLKVTIPENHRLEVRLPDDFPEGPAEVIFLTSRLAGDTRPKPGFDPRAQQRTLAALAELRSVPLSPEEVAVLDGFETFRSEHPIRFASLAEE